MMSVEEKLKQQIKENDILIFMKGTPYEPKCGFSAKTVQALIDCKAKFSYIDILENSDVRSTLPSISDWPTFPQVFVSGELIGGCDIVTQMHEAGELKTVIDSASNQTSD
ncbi:Grx4 family monothiol glutaredoxin [Gammaproteobacteria bacterium]|nr:Grx4 family monothiol glutaredoxin [Gammaproteobacteria bacterium]